MAITNEKSSQMAKLTASPKQTLSLPEYGGKLRIVDDRLREPGRPVWKSATTR